MITYHRDIHMYMELAMRVRDENERHADMYRCNLPDGIESLKLEK